MLRIIDKTTDRVILTFSDIEQLVIYCMENADINENGKIAINGYEIEIDG